MVALGQVGRNVAAGMTGGLGYFYDEEGEPGGCWPWCGCSSLLSIWQPLLACAACADARHSVVAARTRRCCGVPPARSLILDHWAHPLPTSPLSLPPPARRLPLPCQLGDCRHPARADGGGRGAPARPDRGACGAHWCAQRLLALLSEGSVVTPLSLPDTEQRITAQHCHHGLPDISISSCHPPPPPLLCRLRQGQGHPGRLVQRAAEVLAAGAALGGQLPPGLQGC